ncbi:hypothetical protein BH23CHL8_BH23CHL8_24560 [soil metagenome]
MDEAMLRLFLELPIRERIRREHRCPPSLDDPRLSEAQADILEGVIREVLAGLDLTEEQRERGLAIAAAALRRAAGEDRRAGEPYDPMVTFDQHRLAMGWDQQS